MSPSLNPNSLACCEGRANPRAAPVLNFPMERSTRQRRAIRAVFDHSAAPLSAHDVLAAAQSDVAGLGMATVYRTLKALVDARELVLVDLPNEPPRYELAGKAHHHHFYCRGCGRMYEVEGCPGDLAGLTPPGFRLENHDLLLLGLCATCLKSAGKTSVSKDSPERPLAPPRSPHHHHHHAPKAPPARSTEARSRPPRQRS